MSLCGAVEDCLKTNTVLTGLALPFNYQPAAGLGAHPAILLKTCTISPIREFTDPLLLSDAGIRRHCQYIVSEDGNISDAVR